ncbi:MAG: ATP-dependent helicase [Lachnospiraceae bacterium]|nr:ATP-dependent helicase [Lachnospiraceae bacterium]
MTEYNFLKDLNEKQKYVCVSEDNFILTACPGSGKTRTLTYRLAFLCKKFAGSRLLNIAITYTNRAAEEIEERLVGLNIETSSIWTGTIHSFCLNYIIRPYAMYHSRLKCGYRIIDEYIRDEYVKSIAKELGIRGYINDLRKNECIKKKYYNLLEKNKEIDFDLILLYACDLISNNNFIAENISGIIRSIHIDEYQDTNEIQYSILARIINANPKINILFIGDVNQAIYGSLGGVAKSAKEIRKLYPVNFTEECLSGCYRSSQRIVDYYKHFEVSYTGVYSVACHKEELGIIKYNSIISRDEMPYEIAQIIKNELSAGVKENEICIVAPSWYRIWQFTNQLRKLMPETKFDAPDISPIKKDPLNVFYLIARLLFTQNSGHINSRKRVALEIMNILHMDFGISIPEYVDNYLLLKTVNATAINIKDGIETLERAVHGLFSLLKIWKEDIPTLNASYLEFFEKTRARIKNNELKYDWDSIEKSFKEKKGIVINTIHGVKGEEYTTMIGFSLHHGVLPNWEIVNNPDCHDETYKLLYVLCSRAKKNIYLFSEEGYSTGSGYPYEATKVLKQYHFKYD